MNRSHILSRRLLAMGHRPQTFMLAAPPEHTETHGAEPPPPSKPVPEAVGVGPRPTGRNMDKQQEG